PYTTLFRSALSVDTNAPDDVPPVILSGGQEALPPVILSGGQEALPPVTHDRGTPVTHDRGPRSPMTGLNHKRNRPTEPSKDFHVGPDGPTTLPEADSAPIRQDVERLCLHLAERMIGNGCKPPTITKAWRDEARRLIDLDNRTEQEIHNLIDW